MKHLTINALCCFSLAIFAQPIFAQSDSYKSSLSNSPIDEAEVLDTIEVSEKAHRPSISLGSYTRLNRDDLDVTQGATLGDTLSKVAGVQGSYFGTGSNMPTIRSLGGNRVSIVNNQLDVADVAAISGNLPIAVDAMLADSITVEKTGGAAVLYGGKAIGGAINVADSLIPKRLPENGRRFSGRLDMRTGHNTGQTQWLRLEGNNGKNWAWHIDASQRRVSSVRIKGETKAAICRDENQIYTSGQYAGVDSRLAALCQVRADIDSKLNPAFYPYLNLYYIRNPDELAKLGSEANPYTTQPFNWSFFENNPANPDYIPGTTEQMIRVRKPISDMVPVASGHIPNSHQRQQQFSIGSSYLGEQGYIGISMSRYLNRYGVPGFASLATQSGADGHLFPVDIHSEQTRWALEGKWFADRLGIESVQLSAALTDSQNGEYLGETLSSSIDSKVQQLRLEVKRQPWRGSSGIYGFDWKKRRLQTTGADRYLPNTNTDEQGFFALEHLNLGRVQLEGGIRLGWVKHRRQDPNFVSYYGALYPQDRQFSLTQKHLAGKWQITENLSVQLQRTLAQRAPDVHELYAGNQHLAILTQETGNGRLAKEKLASNNLTLQWKSGGFQAALSYYQNRFQNYLYLGQTGLVRNGLMAKQWRQANQKIQGMEWELAYSWQTQKEQDWRVGVFIDHVKSFPQGNDADDQQRVRFDGQYLPGLPTSRYGINIDWQNPHWRVNTSLVRYQKQRYRGNYYQNAPEPDLGGYVLWDMYLSYRHRWLGSEFTWYAEGKNLTNTEARPFNSPLKYLSPLPGRSIAIGMRMDF